MAIPQYDAAGDLLAWKLEHTAQQVDDTIDGLSDKADQTALEAEQSARQQADQTLQGNIEAEVSARTAADNELKSVLTKYDARVGCYPLPLEMTSVDINTNMTNGVITVSEGKIGISGTQNYWKRTHISVAAGDKFFAVTKFANYVARPYAFAVDDEMNIIESYMQNTDEVTGITKKEYIVIPNGATQLWIMSYNLDNKYYMNLQYIENVYDSYLDAYFDVTAVTDEIKSNFVPSYYDDYLSQKEMDIRNKMALTGKDGITFGFITDQHWSTNAKQSSKLLRELTRTCAFDTVVSGGDMITASDSKSGAYGLISEYVETLKKAFIYDDAILDVGNHEWNNASGSTPSLQLTETEIYPFVLQGIENKISVMSDTMAYYVDFQIKKLRMFVIPCDYDSSIKPDTRVWLAEQLLTIPEGYKVLVVSHVGLLVNNGTVSLHSAYNHIHGILEAYAKKGSIRLWQVPYNYVDAKGEYLFAITGHSHKDAFLYKDNLLCIGTTTDNYSSELGGLTRTLGTTTEQAFDVVNNVLSDGDNVAYLTRIGAGVDRTFHYTPVKVESGNTETLASTLVNVASWESSDTTVATVASGTVSALTVGNTVIKATDSNGNFETWLVIVS